MPQLDKVTFLSQFFWFCVVFITMYLVLVKFYLPAIARIVKVRQNLASDADEEANSVESTNAAIYTQSIEASMTAFQMHSTFLESWSAQKVRTLLKKVSPKFNGLLQAIRTNSLLAENFVQAIVPPVGHVQIASMGNTVWYTSSLNVYWQTAQKMSNEMTSRAKSQFSTTAAAAKKSLFAPSKLSPTKVKVEEVTRGSSHGDLKAKLAANEATAFFAEAIAEAEAVQQAEADAAKAGAQTKPPVNAENKNKKGGNRGHKKTKK